MITSRSLDDLLPQVKVKCEQFIQLCATNGIDILITSTYRDKESQNALYSQGRTSPGSLVTNAKGGDSFHQYRCAFDFVPVVGGKADWSNTATFTTCGKLGASIGLEWAGNWKGFRELAHLQYTGGLTLDDLKSGKVPK